VGEWWGVGGILGDISLITGKLALHCLLTHEYIERINSTIDYEIVNNKLESM
jgi:hypothetical protein